LLTRFKIQSFLQDDFVQSKAGAEAKEKFIKAVLRSEILPLLGNRGSIHPVHDPQNELVMLPSNSQSLPEDWRALVLAMLPYQCNFISTVLNRPVRTVQNHSF